MKYYKFLSSQDNSGVQGFNYSDYVPGGRFENQWLPRVEYIGICTSGYHASTLLGIGMWANTQMFEVEFLDDCVLTAYEGDKVCGNSFRFIKKVETWTMHNKLVAALACIKFMAERVKIRNKKAYERLLPMIKLAEDQLDEDDFEESLKSKVRDWFTEERIRSTSLSLCLCMLEYLLNRDENVVFRTSVKGLLEHAEIHGGKVFNAEAKRFVEETMRQVFQLE